MEIRANAAIDYVCQGFTIVHAHEIFVLELLDLGPRHTLRHRLICYIHRVVHSCDGFRENSNNYYTNPRGSNADVHAVDVNYFKDKNKGNPIVEFINLRFKINSFTVCDASEHDSVLKLRAQVNYFCFQDKIQKERVGVNVSIRTLSPKAVLSSA